MIDAVEPLASDVFHFDTEYKLSYNEVFLNFSDKDICSNTNNAGVPLLLLIYIYNLF